MSFASSPAAAPGRRRAADWRGIVLPLAAFAIWWALAASHVVKSGLLVGPDAVLRTAWAQVTSGALARALSASLAREACGFAIGAATGSSAASDRNTTFAASPRPNHTEISGIHANSEICLKVSKLGPIMRDAMRGRP
ncbi:hypothetical protein OIV42_31945, partial [Burkholderia pseudomallei]|nr:hypothetical protein [Burkholderia pseudomallei]